MNDWLVLNISSDEVAHKLMLINININDVIHLSIVFKLCSNYDRQRFQSFLVRWIWNEEFAFKILEESSTLRSKVHICDSATAFDIS